MRVSGSNPLTGKLKLPSVSFGVSNNHYKDFEDFQWILILSTAYDDEINTFCALYFLREPFFSSFRDGVGLSTYPKTTSDPEPEPEGSRTLVSPPDPSHSSVHQG